MKLAHSGTAMLIVSTCLLMLSCKPKSGLEQLTAKYESMVGFRSTYVVHQKGKPDVEVKASGSAPARLKVEGKGFEVVCNEEQGYYESLFDRKIYDWQPNYRGTSIGTGKLVPRNYVDAGPGLGAGPQKLGPGKWKREPDQDGHEKYSQDWESMAGKMHIELVVSTKGEPISYLAPSKVLYTFKSVEFVDRIPVSEFNIAPFEGFVCFRVDGKMPSIVTGIELNKDIISKGGEKIAPQSLIVMYDAEAYDAAPIKKWLATFAPKVMKLVGTRGPSSEALNTSEEKFDQTFSSSPTIILMGQNGKIAGLWMGFDPTETKQMELEIRELLLENS